MASGNCQFSYPCGLENCYSPFQYCYRDPDRNPPSYECKYCNVAVCKSTTIPDGCKFYCNGSDIQDVVQSAGPRFSDAVTIFSITLNCILFIVLLLTFWLLRHSIMKWCKRVIADRCKCSQNPQTQDQAERQTEETSVMLPLGQQPVNDGTHQSANDINLRHIRTNDTQPIQENPFSPGGVHQARGSDTAEMITSGR